MKKVYIVWMLSVLLLISACSPTFEKKPQSTQLPDSSTEPVTQSQSGGSGLYIEIDERNMEYFLRANVSDSNFVLEGTVKKKETFAAGKCPYMRNPVPWDIYTFEDFEILAGKYEADTFLLQVPHGESFSPLMEYEVGRKYIVPVHHTDSVFSNEEFVIYQNLGICCRLSEENPEVIDKLTQMDYQTERVWTKQEFYEMIDEEIGFVKHYYNPIDYYAHTDSIPEIVAFASLAAKVTVNAIEGEPKALANHGICTLEKLYKGEMRDAKEGDSIDICIQTGSMEAGKTYLVLFQPEVYEIRRDGTPRDAAGYSIAAKKNCVIPMDDTERVNEVYAALGIKP